MKRISPPVGVQASPVETPGSLVRLAVSRNTFCLPRNSTTCFSPTVSRLRPSSATMRANLRAMVPIWRSRLRTPASRV